MTYSHNKHSHKNMLSPSINSICSQQQQQQQQNHCLRTDSTEAIGARLKLILLAIHTKQWELQSTMIQQQQQ